MRKITLLLASAGLIFSSFAQNTQNQISPTTPNLNTSKLVVNSQVDLEQLSQDLEALATKTPDGRIRCFSTEYNEMMRAKYPNLESTIDFESWIAPKIDEYNNNIANGSVQKVVVTIPVIMHIIHNSTEAVGTGRNISQAQATSQITILNNDYRKLNADVSLTPAPFMPLTADLEINFVPALRYASNHPLAGQTLAEPGIDRISAPTIAGVANTTTGYTTAFIDASIKTPTYWNRTEVMNIWVCQISGGILGYAQFPTGSGLTGLTGGATGATTDGLVLNYNATGTGGATVAPYNKGRTATHEIGHWLGLRHIWGDETACAADDYVTDTPQQKDKNFGCPSYPQTTGTGGRCSTGDPSSMYMNYMDYTDDACMFMFTAGQKARVLAVLANSPGRVELPTSPLGSPLVITAAFVGAPLSIPIGNTVTFTDQSTSPNTITTWNWTFTGGTPSTFSGKTPPAITYSAAGNYNVSLTIIDNLAGTSTLTKNAYINVYGTTAAFVGTPLSILAGASVNFTDSSVSNNTITTWNWTFTGGTPSSFSGKIPPAITYNTPGSYDVSLTVIDNLAGTNTLTKNAYVNVAVAPPCDTLNFPPPGTIVSYSTGAGLGYVIGSNQYLDKAKAEYISSAAHAPYTVVTGGYIGVRSAKSGVGSTATVDFKIWAADGPAGAPGTVLATKIVPLSTLNTNTTGYENNIQKVMFDAPLNVGTADYYFGFVMTNFKTTNPANTKDTLGVFSNTSGDSSPGTAWEQQSDNIWYDVDAAWGGLPITSFLSPIMAKNLPTPVITANTTNICVGGSVNFNASTSLNATSYNWAFTNGTPATSTSTAQTVTYATAGSQKAYLTANGDCGLSKKDSVVITVAANVTPTFTAVTPKCSGSAIAALPTTSTNGITGTWAPAINNTATTTYTFTPTAGQCATTTTMSITITPNVTPTFTAVTPKCSGSAIAALPTTSTNGITGTWAPAINNTATTTYTFTPTAGQCATTTTMSITITPNVTPTFTAVTPQCSGSAIAALPTTSTNGITGTWAPAINNTATTTYTFTPTAGQCATTTTMSITITPNVTPTFTAVTPQCSGSAIAALPTTSTNGITGTWAPAINNTATTTYTFTPTAGQCATTTTMSITITPNVTPTFTAVTPKCSGSAIAALPTTSTNGITGTWAPAINNTATTTYTFTPTAGQCATTTTMSITITPNVTPTFTAVTPKCSGSAIAALPTTSTNGITGTWAPAINNTATTTYTFTPTAGQCATTTTMSITITPNVTPTFTAVTPQCSGSAIAALPTTSTNGITGTWAPAINNTATTTYTFTPTAGQCATTTTMSITITPNVTPTFTAVTPQCSGSAIAALPTTSTNGITGTWAPAINNTATTTYTFTPTAGQCATTTTMSITITPNVTPTFTAVTPKCSGSAIAALPTTSTNGITGTWAPAINNTATTTYTFTPTAGQCATTTTMSITITPNVTPTFTAVTPQCSGSAIAALPTTSTNGITGTWAPAINNTATTTYTFTPTAGQCATTTTMSITITPNVTPTFTAVTPQCSGSAIAALPTTSTNGITGTWSPAINNTATTTYTFTPTAGQCATSTTLTINVNPGTLPSFTPVSAICSGGSLSPLPTTSTNGITGTWSPALDNTTTTTYTFTPDAGQCAIATTMVITVNSSTVTPTFAAVSGICSGDALSALPAISTNGITGTWSPALDNTTTTTYSFTPDAGQCATTATLSITVTPNVTPTFAAVSAICSGATLAALPTTSTNGIIGTWSPALDNMNTTTYSFTPTAGQCATTATMTITINPNVIPTFTAVTPKCSGATLSALPTTSTNGIIGTWSPALDNMNTTTYSFTPTAGQCATTATMTITINPNVIPTFTAVTPKCSGATLSALPTTSTNGIIGTWSPALDNMNTTTYSFTPTAGQCATTATMTITINPNVTPTFTAVTPKCSGATLSALPTTSTNGITGTWSPALDNVNTTTYTFTPDAGQCATSTTLTITVIPNTTPTFAAVSSICSGGTLSALPTTSTNGITGTWSPALDNVNTTTYTFTPDAGQCATTATTTITVNPNVTPTFAAVSAICSGGTLSALPTTSTNGITGTWSPALDNMNTTTYTFTPDAGQCATTATTTITVNPNVTPTFAAVSAICSGATLAALPTTSTNGITGTWSPALDNMNTTTYTFTPDAGQCATTSTITITVDPADNAGISYPQTTYCIFDNDATPSITGTIGGTFASTPAGLSINAVTGLIGISTSVDGAYSVNYTTAGICPVTASTSVIIDLCIGISEINNSTIKVYPNPTANTLTIESAILSVDRISLINVLGDKVVDVNTYGATKSIINVSDFAFGIYLLQLQNSKGGVIYTQKISIK